MKKAICMVALAAISYGSVYAALPMRAQTQTDTTKMKVKKKTTKMKKKVKKDTTKM